MKTIIAGSRAISDYDLLCRVMEYARKLGIAPTVVISGMAKGIDTLGVKWALEHSIDDSNIWKFPVTPEEWRRNPYTAGHIRNKEMGDIADACVVVHDGVKVKSGSTHMRDYAKSKGLRVVYWNVLKPPPEPLDFI